MRTATHATPADRSTTDTERLDLLDVLHDVVDEYDADNCDLRTLTYELGAIITTLDPDQNPSWLAELGQTWLQLRVLRAEQLQARTTTLTSAQHQTSTLITSKIRKLVNARSDPPTTDLGSALTSRHASGPWRHLPC